MPSKIETDAREMPQTCCVQRDQPQDLYRRDGVFAKQQREQTVASNDVHTLFSQVRHCIHFTLLAWRLSASKLTHFRIEPLAEGHTIDPGTDLFSRRSQITVLLPGYSVSCFVHLFIFLLVSLTSSFSSSRAFTGKYLLLHILPDR